MDGAGILFASAVSFGMAYFTNGFTRIEKGAAGLASAPTNAVSNNNLGGAATPTPPHTGKGTGGGASAGSGIGGSIGGTFGNSNGGARQ